MTRILSHIWTKLLELLHYPLGWLAGLGLFIGDALLGGKFLIYLIVIATAIDLACGIAVSVKRKNFARSELMRQTVEKLVVYGAAIIMFLCIDKVIENETTLTMDITSGIVAVVITMTETWSFLASMLILFPANPFLRMFQKALVGEIARKLGCEEDEVKEILNASVKRKKQAKQPRLANGQYAPKKK